MFATLAAVVLSISVQAPQKSLLEQVVPKPTGVNGYEDYLRAADLLNGSPLDFYLNWTPDRYEQTLELTKPSEDGPPQMDMADTKNREMLALMKRLDGMSRLEVQREAVAKYGKALDLVALGNSKRVWDPRGQIDALTLFPEFARFKSLARLADTAAFVAFADGQSLRGTKYLLNAYQLGVNLESGTLISNLVGIAIEAIALSGIERHLDSISRADAGAIESAVPPMLGGRPRILAALDIEQQMTLNVLADALKGGEMFEANLSGDAMDDASKALMHQIKALTPARRAVLLERGRKKLEADLIKIRKRFSGPESNWFEQVSAEQDDEEEIEVPANPEAFVDMVVESGTSVWNQVGSASAKARTQLRLLGLSASVIRYKWDHGKMPASLADAVAKDKLKDPLSQEDFQYERQGAWGFRVFSKGSPSIGEIGLKYKRPISKDNGPGDNGNPPPP